MKNKFSLLGIIIFLSFCFAVFFKGLNSSNIYSPKVSEKENIPLFEAKDFNSTAYLNSKKFLKKTYFIL